MFDLNGKNAIVTGGAKGIGKGIALILAKAGANVFVVDIDLNEGMKTAKEIEALGKKSGFMKCDVSKKREIENAVKIAVKELGSLNILVNNAGIYPFKPFVEMSEQDWDNVIDTNLKSNFLFSQTAAKEMIANKKGGKIVSISSIASFLGYVGLAHYCASKSGINGLTRAMALELAPHKINVNAIGPGAIETPGTQTALKEEQAKQFLQLIPWKRFGKPEDIGYLALYLCSPESDYITGQVIYIDGGWIIE